MVEAHPNSRRNQYNTIKVSSTSINCETVRGGHKSTGDKTKPDIHTVSENLKDCRGQRMQVRKF
jgi:hypothetical protein